MKTAKPNNNRRNFLLAAGLGGAGAAAAVATGIKPQARAKIAAAEAQPSGYHVTDHIQKYYKTTEV
jgi:nitrous oxide reductase